MYSVSDFENILNYLTTGDNTSGLSTKIIALAKAEQVKSAQLFEETIDQSVYSSSDYLQLRSLIINWYATLKTLYSFAKNSSDINSIPDEYLFEEFKSRGFMIGESFKNIPYDDKIKLYHDLNNLYKIKGSPESIFKMLNYFGLPDTDIVEYWLEKDEKNNLIFKANVILTSDTTSTNKPYTNIPYDVTKYDPHWMISKEQMEKLLEANKITLPSKSPYFGIRPLYNLDDVEAILAVFAKYIENEYIKHHNGIIATSNIETKLGYKMSLFGLYIASIYSYKKFYGTFGYDHGKKLYYNGDATSLEDVILDYRNRISRPLKRTEITIDSTTFEHKIVDTIKDKISTLRNLYTRNVEQSFLYGMDLTALGNLLLTFQDGTFIKQEIDFSYENASEEVLKALTTNFSDALNDFFGIDKYSKFNLGSYLFDFDEYSLGYIKETINFFKPYRSRIQFSEKIYNIKNPLENTIIVEDDFREARVITDVTDSETAGGKRSPVLNDDYNRNIYDNRSYYDIGASNDNFLPPVELSESFIDITNFHRKSGDAGFFFISDGTTTFDGTTMLSDISDLYIGSGYQKFDSGWSFDGSDGNDLLHIKIYNTIPNENVVMWYNADGPEFNSNDYPVGGATISAPNEVYKNGEIEFTNLTTDTATVDIYVHDADQNIINKLPESGRVGIILDDSLEEN